MDILIIGLVLCSSCGLFSMKEISEDEFISRMGHEKLLELIHEQKEAIRQKDRALKRLLTRFTGSSRLPKNWLNSEIIFDELLKDPKLLKDEIIALLERQKTLIVEKDEQIEIGNKKLKLLNSLFCAPIYVTTCIEAVHKKYNLVQNTNENMKKNWLEFVTRNSEPFAESIREELKSRKPIMTAEKFCCSIVDLFTNASFHAQNFIVDFPRALLENKTLPEATGIFRVGKVQVYAFNVLLKVSGLPIVKATADGELQISVCENADYLERYYKHNSQVQS